MKIKHSTKASWILAPIVLEKHKKYCCRADRGEQFAGNMPEKFSRQLEQTSLIAGRFPHHFELLGTPSFTATFLMP
jgi:hypothetical protein